MFPLLLIEAQFLDQLHEPGIYELWPQAAALFGLGALIFALSVLRFRKKLE